MSSFSKNADRLERLAFIPNSMRNHMVAFAGEYFGTFSFLFMGFMAIEVARLTVGNETFPTTMSLLFISAAYGTSLMVNAWIFYRITGGMFNPAVTLGLVLGGAVPWQRGLVVVPAQFLGSLSAAGAVSGLLPGVLSVSTGLGEGVTVLQGLIIEMLLTTLLITTVLFLAVETHKARHMAPIAIGGALFVGHIAGIPWTGASINPARSFGPEIVSGFKGHDWIYYIGPFLGAFLANGVYRLMKFLEYETSNPGQDFDDQEALLFNPPNPAVHASDVRRPIVVPYTV